MKRKIFSKLLMVALVIAAVGSFVSCKDYDDDINNLQKQIDAKAALSELTALQSTLDSKIAAAQSAAQKAAEDAAAKADASLKSDLEKAIADAKKAGTDAGTQAGEAIAAANKAAQAAEDAAQAAKDADAAAKKDLADALKTIEETYQTKAEAAAAATEAAKALADVKAIADAAYTKAEAEKLQEQVNGLKADLESTIEEKVAEAIKNVNNAVASVDAIWSAVTSVEIFASEAGGQDYKTLKLFYGKEVASIFGDETATDATPAKTYEADREIDFTNDIIARVNPVKASFTADQVMIINSKGEDLVEQGIVTVKVEKYNGLITRGVETGLWRVQISRDAKVEDSTIKKAVYGNTQNQNSALFALAINNTKDVEDRYVASTFDMDVKFGKYYPAKAFTFNVNNLPVTGIKNRWNGTNMIGEEGTIGYDDPENKELEWGADSVDVTMSPYKYYPTMTTQGLPIPAAKRQAAADGKVFNTVLAAGDEIRINKPLLKTNLGESIIISDIVSSRALRDENGKITNNTAIQYYYVALDLNNAIESNPSESNIWPKYDIDGLNKITSAEDKLTITINDDSAIGDIIGFRVYAVNYDGTLADPDGKAFYVQVGDATAESKEVKEVTAQTVSLLPGETAEFAFDGKTLGEGGTAFVHAPRALQKEFYANGAAATPVAGNVTSDGVPFKVTLNGAPSAATKYTISYDPGSMVDGCTYTQTYAIARKKNLNTNELDTVRFVTFTITKTLPSTITLPEKYKFELATNVGDASGNVKVFVDNTGAAATANATKMYYNATNLIDKVDWNEPKYSLTPNQIFSAASLDSLKKYGAGMALYFAKLDTITSPTTTKALNVYAKGTTSYDVKGNAMYSINFKGDNAGKYINYNYSAATAADKAASQKFGLLAGTASAVTAGYTNPTDAKVMATAAGAARDIFIPSWANVDGTTKYDLMAKFGYEKISRPANSEKTQAKSRLVAASDYPANGYTKTGISFTFAKWTDAIKYNKLGQYEYQNYVPAGKPAATDPTIAQIMKNSEVKVEYGHHWTGMPVAATHINAGMTAYDPATLIDLTLADILMSNSGYPTAIASPLTLDKFLNTKAAATAGQYYITSVGVYKDPDGKAASTYYQLGTAGLCGTANEWIADAKTATDQLTLDFIGGTIGISSNVTEYVIIDLADGMGLANDFQLRTWDWSAAAAPLDWTTAASWNPYCTNKYTTRVVVPITIVPAGSL